MPRDPITLLTAELLDEEAGLTLAELCRACRLPAEQILELVEHGVLEPRGREPARWRFHSVSIRRARSALRLQHDLGVNAAGAALALELLEEIERLRTRMGRFED